MNNTHKTSLWLWNDYSTYQYLSRTRYWTADGFMRCVKSLPVWDRILDEIKDTCGTCGSIIHDVESIDWKELHAEYVELWDELETQNR